MEFQDLWRQITTVFWLLCDVAFVVLDRRTDGKSQGQKNVGKINKSPLPLTDLRDAVTVTSLPHWPST